MALAEATGRLIAERGLRLVYGGGGIGLMGGLARAASAHGAEIIGIMPDFLAGTAEAPDIVKPQIVSSMHERKMAMFQAADAFVVLPGGIGTLEELVETLSWAHLSLHAKPIVLLPDEYWAPFLTLLEYMDEAGFLYVRDRHALIPAADPADGLDKAASAASAADKAKPGSQDDHLTWQRV